MMSFSIFVGLSHVRHMHSAASCWWRFIFNFYQRFIYVTFLTFRKCF